ncbi:hypothetical protein QO209_10905 [Pseudomonas citronellolis]|uniref:hypothetical protein n=1 Tax=Pseudomonas citronellolis TaxID=53408 RepID=UPI00264A185D|nr:hypothetical protein [Pseudomonas citronellolis]MDN6872955.1 hypothetical protein [Pseudomonas citronellolis]
MGPGIAGNGLSQRAHALVNLGDLADLALLLSQQASLQVDHLLRLAGSLLRSVSTLGLEIDARAQPPPDEPGTEGDEQCSHKDLNPGPG